ncbi:hypothetical protein MKX01_015607 [Papaver californicum]|nr:hypothetical protein MKX01_015607 [Papaver californicum]
MESNVLSDHKSSVNSVAWAPPELGICLAVGLRMEISRFGGWEMTKINQAHPVGVTSAFWAPAKSPGVGSGLLDPVQKLVSGCCDNIVKVWKLYDGTWKMDCFQLRCIRWVRDIVLGTKSRTSKINYCKFFT